MDDHKAQNIESLAEVYSLIVTIDQIERAYIRDSIGQSEYAAVCTRLLAQYNALVKNKDVDTLVGNIDAFATKYNMNNEIGVERIKVGIPATSEAPSVLPVSGRDPETSPENTSAKSPAVPGRSAKAVAEVTSQFIAVMDGLTLKFRTKEELHPLFSELLTNLNKANSGADFEGRGKLVEWLIRLNKMKIDDELSEEQARQCLFDVESAYKSFFAGL